MNNQYDAEEKKRKINPWLMAGAAGLGTYALSRFGYNGKKVHLAAGDASPKSSLRKGIDKILHGVDDIHYTDSLRKNAPRSPKKVNAIVLHQQENSNKFISGTKNIGGISSGQVRHFDNKANESTLLNSISKRIHPETSIPKFDYDWYSNFLAKNKNNGFIIKPVSGMAAGVGGHAFINDIDLSHFFSGYHKGISKKKLKAIEAIKKNPNKFIIQHDMGIKKDIFGNSREMRVHVLDGKVVPGATSPRAANVLDYRKAGGVNKDVQRLLDKMPSHEKKNLAMALDVAITDNGNKVIELNRGAMSSGLLDPRFSYRSGGLFAGLNSMKLNNAQYRHLTGADTKLFAAGKGVAAAGLAGSIGSVFNSRQRDE